MPLIMALCVVLGVFIGTFYANHFSGNRLSIINSGSNKLNNLLHIIDDQYVDTVNVNDLVEKAMPQILAELDPHSVYIAAKDVQMANDDLRGSFSGVGIEFTIRQDTLHVQQVIGNGPAERAGVIAGDKVVMVDDKPFTGKTLTNEVAMHTLKGPKDTKVKLGILRYGEKEALQDRSVIIIRIKQAERLPPKQSTLINTHEFFHGPQDRLYISRRSWLPNSLDDANALVNILKSYDQVQFFTGHTHKMYNIDNSGTTHVFEHNAGAVCATWWWSANQTPGIHIAQDGAPGGYSIVDVTGNTFKWKFKGTGRDINHQFRSYDRNQIALTAETWTPSASSANITSWNSYAKDWSATSTANYVYINVWNYDPSWKVEVTENGRALSVTRVTIKDPLHLIAYTAKRLNANKSNSFPTSDNNHTFRVQASTPTSTLEIRVTDRFGNVYTETMTRPKNFNASVYK